MDQSIINRIFQIRQWLDNDFFLKIKIRIHEKGLIISKQNFDLISREIFSQSHSPYCNYVAFLSYYFLKSDHENT